MLSEEDLLDILHQEMPLHDRLFFRGQIPARKLRNACKVHSITEPGQVLLLYDDTVFGSAKLGYVFTPNAFAFRGTLEHPALVEYRHLTPGDIENKGKSVTVKERKIEFTIDHRLLSRGLCTSLDRIVQSWAAGSVTTPYRSGNPQMRQEG